MTDLVGNLSRTHAVVACELRQPGAPELRGVRVHELGRVAQQIPVLPYPRVLRTLLAGVTVATRAQVLHAHFGYFAPHVARVAYHVRRPWVVSLHGHDLLVEGGSATDPDLVRAADLVIVPSRFLADAARRAGFPAERITVIPSGIDLKRYPFRPRRPAADGRVIVSFVGRFVAKKGVLDAAEALVETVRRHPQVEARLVGFGPLEAEVRNRLDGCPVRLVDGSPDGAVARALQETDLLVTPSRTAPDGDAESLGLVNVEAQASGIPVLSTRHGGIPEAVGPGAGILVPEGEVLRIVQGLESLLADPGRWPAMGEAGRRHVYEHFELHAQVAKVEERHLHLARGRRNDRHPATGLRRSDC